MVFPIGKLLIKIYTHGILRGCLQPSELFAGVQYGPHWSGIEKGGECASSAGHRPVALLAPQSRSSPVLLALVSVLLVWVKKESCFKLI